VVKDEDIQRFMLHYHPRTSVNNGYNLSNPQKRLKNYTIFQGEKNKNLPENFFIQTVKKGDAE
jgi:hypothetical protein